MTLAMGAYFFLIALILAHLEIQIEGPHGWAQKLPTWRFYQVFGMTETGGFATVLRWKDHLTSGPKAARLRSAGQAAPGNEVKVVLPDGSEAPRGTLGEIVVRSDMLMTVAPWAAAALRASARPLA